MSDFLASTTQKHLQREETIGATRRVVDLSHTTPSSTSAVLPVVSLKTLYTDFEVRELPAFYKNGAPLQLELESLAPKEKDESPTASTATDRLSGAKRGREEEEKKESNVLTDTPLQSCDAESKMAITSEDQTDTAAVAAAATPQPPAASVAEIMGPLISTEDLAALLSGLAAEAKSIPLPSVVEKEKRGQLHAAIKACLGTTHVSNTVDGVVCVVKANAADRREERRRSRAGQPQQHRPPPTYHHFTLYKENTDSNQALRMIATHLKLSSRQLQFCGTKDKRAVTLQRVAIRETTVERLKSINNRTFGLHNVIKVCGFTQEPHGLRLGDANGNHFRIALRVFPDQTGSSPSNSQLTAAYLDEVQRVVRAHGVINYFGPQRFGTTAVLTSDVGVQFLRGDLREGLRLMLASKATIVPEMAKAVDLFEQQRYADALQAAPYYCYQERDVLKHLSTNPNDYLGALQSMARTMAMMYFHAVQSLVWNRIASARLSSHARMQVEVGDLVLDAVYQARLSGKDGGNSTAAVTAAEGEDEGGEGVASSSDAADAKMPTVRKLASDEECALFTLADVMLPVPGPDQDLVYPEAAGCTAADYTRVLQELQINFQSKEALSLIKIFHFHGTYRALGVRPKDFELRLETAASWRTPVLHSDWELYCAQEKLEMPSGSVTEAVAATEPQGEVQVVVAAFSLPPGSYATSVLREFCIPSTESFRGNEVSHDE